MNLLSTHLASPNTVNDPSTIPSPSYTPGICPSVALSHTFSSHQFWIVDLGASNHIYSHAHLFTTLAPISYSSITLTNSTTIQVHYSGNVKLSPCLTPKNVLFVLEFHLNLISISSLTTTTNPMIDFFSDYFTIQEIHNMKIIGKGKKLEGLYVLDVYYLLFVGSNTFVSTVSISFQTWHNRLGHLSFKCFTKLKAQLPCTSSRSSSFQPPS